MGVPGALLWPAPAGSAMREQTPPFGGYRAGSGVARWGPKAPRDPLRRGQASTILLRPRILGSVKFASLKVR